MKRVAVYIPTASCYMGGGERVPLNQAKELSKLGNEVTVVVVQHPEESDFFKSFVKDNPKITVVRLPYPKDVTLLDAKNMSHQLTHLLYLHLSRIANGHFADGNYDVVITHYGPANFAIPANVKHIYFVHGVPPNETDIDHASLRLADQVVGVSHYVSDEWERKFDFKGIKTIHNGIDEADFKPSGSEPSVDVLYVGRLIEIKGIQYLIEAMGQINNKDAKLNICGAGPYEDELKAKVKELGLESRVNLVGYLPDDALAATYNTAKVCAFPSFAREGVLTTMLEAAASSRAIITTDACSMTEFLENDVNGLVVKSQDSSSLAVAIDKLLENPELRNKLGAAARETVVNGWRWADAGKRLHDLVEEVAK